MLSKVSDSMCDNVTNFFFLELRKQRASVSHLRQSK